MSCPAAQAYANACTRERTDIAPEIIDALNMGDRECAPSNGRPLVDADLRCIAEALRMPHGLRCLSLEENAFGLDGVSAILDALSVNPGTLLELRLGKNKLKDPSVISIANTIMTTPLGLKVIDLGDNGITKLGCEALCNALVSKECSLIEVSLHSNQLEADSGIALAKAIRSAILKHLHLGYNQLRDAGATQLARCIPITSTLTTLDLTSNRIGPQGGQELARALMSATCSLQRINLRHNNFDNETIQLFSEVLLRNTSLTQLFLGFMNPSPETAAMVLTSLRQNRTLLLLDIYGWKLDLDTTGQVIEDIMFHNMTIRAITSDACQPIYHTIDKHNQERDSRSLHEVYIGPDDRHSAKAAFVKNSSSSRGASRSQQPGSSPQAHRVVSPQRGDAQQAQQAQQPPAARGPHDSQNNSMQARTASPQPASRGPQPNSANNRQQSQQQQQPRQVAVVQPVPSRGQQSPAQNSANSRQQPQPMQASDRQSSPPNSRAASQSNRGAAAPATQQQQQPAVAQQQQPSRAAPQQAPAQGASRAQPAANNNGGGEDVKALIAQMQGKMDAQQKQHDAKIAELERRIRALEEGKEDKKKGGANTNGTSTSSRGGSPARVQPAQQQQQQGGQQGDAQQQSVRGQQSPMNRSHQSAVAPASQSQVVPASQSQRGQPQQGGQGDAFDAQPQQQSARGQQSPMNRSQQGQSQNNQSQPQYQEVVPRSYQQPQQSQQQPPQRASSSGRGAGQQQQPTPASRAPLTAGGNQMQPFGAQRLGGSSNTTNNSAPNSANNRSTPQHRPDQQSQQQQPQRAGAGRPQPHDGGMMKSSSPQPRRDSSSLSPQVERRATSEAVMDVPEDMLIGQHPAQSPAQPNEPSNIAEDSLPAPDLQPSFHEAPNARMESKPNDWPMQLPRRKAPPRSDV